ncbi:MAG: 1-phosphofructokinase family hexose kinase [Planctomycetota bacterium]
MILSAGLTPAWQQILVFDWFRYGEVNRAAEVHWCASGKVFNAGIAVHHLGGESLTLATAGGLPLMPIRAEMESLGVPLEIVETESATRVCTTMLDRRTGTMTELVENGRPLSESELEAYAARFFEAAGEAEVVTFIGTLPRGTPPSYYRRLLENVSCPTVLDFRGEGLLGCLELKPTVIKPNREELERTVGHALDSNESLLAAMRSCNERGARWVVITDGPRAVWLTSRNETYRFPPPTVPQSDVVNPIGSGDSMAAAIAWAVRDGLSMPEAVRLGIGASVDNLAQLLPCRLCPDRVRKIADTVRIESQ